MPSIRVNKQQWDSLSEDDRQKIARGLTDSGVMKAGDSIIGDPSTQPFDENTQIEPMWNPIKDACKFACDAAATAGGAWCTANTVGIGLAVCIAAAEAARQECRNRC